LTNIFVKILSPRKIQKNESTNVHPNCTCWFGQVKIICWAAHYQVTLNFANDKQWASYSGGQKRTCLWNFWWLQSGFFHRRTLNEVIQANKVNLPLLYFCIAEHHWRCLPKWDCLDRDFEKVGIQEVRTFPYWKKFHSLCWIYWGIQWQLNKIIFHPNFFTCEYVLKTDIFLSCWMNLFFRKSTWQKNSID